jgi:hypothetical protein
MRGIGSQGKGVVYFALTECAHIRKCLPAKPMRDFS